MILSRNELITEVLNTVLIGSDISLVNGSSIDVRLSNKILIEDKPNLKCPKCNIFIDSNESFFDNEYYSSYISCTCGYSGSMVQFSKVVDPTKKEQLTLKEIDIGKGYVIYPGVCFLAATQELFYMPSNLSAEFKLKSSVARIFLNNMLACHCDPHWIGSALTLELQNCTKYHPIKIWGGMKIGQMIFHRNSPVPIEDSYAVKGQYNNNSEVTASKGAK